MKFKVNKIIDGDTFEVSPSWEWGEQSGNLVKIYGYTIPETEVSGTVPVQEKLESLILNKEVELKNPIRITYGRLLCKVHYEGKNIADNFPEYTTPPDK